MEMIYFDNYREHYINKSDETINSYEQSVKQYYEFCLEKYGWSTEKEIVEKTTWSEVTLFRNSLIKKGLSPFSVNARISGLRSFFKFLMLSHVITSNPAEEVENVNTQSVEQNRDFLTEEEYKVLIKTIQTPSGKKQDKFSFTSKRDAFFVGLLVVGGFRISEALDMTINQINRDKKQVTVLGKGAKLRTVPLTGSVIKLMDEYLKERELLATDCDKLFVNIKGDKLSRQGTNKNLKKYCDRAGIDKDITNHSLRHTAITTMMEKGTPVAVAQVIAGHTDPKVTSRYYSKHLKTDVEESMLPDLD